MNDEHKKTKHKIPVPPPFPRDHNSTKVITHKMSPSVRGDNRVLLGKCHFLVTFLVTFHFCHHSQTKSGLYTKSRVVFILQTLTSSDTANLRSKIKSPALDGSEAFRLPGMALRPPGTRETKLPPKVAVFRKHGERNGIRRGNHNYLKNNLTQDFPLPVPKCCFDSGRGL
ncbi:MAG: hypothetical protein JWN25_3655 [Verrucomicrobiales bacterium]|nr:hypothetical protein [Verrucomicrobiales bacterium]